MGIFEQLVEHGEMSFTDEPYNVPDVMCVSGMKLTVCANDRGGCLPSFNCGPYTHIKVYTQFDLPTRFRRYYDGASYNYVPVEYVRRLIKNQGGEVCHTSPISSWAF
jgi:hypothetical protein